MIDESYTVDNRDDLQGPLESPHCDTAPLYRQGQRPCLDEAEERHERRRRVHGRVLAGELPLQEQPQREAHHVGEHGDGAQHPPDGAASGLPMAAAAGGRRRADDGW